MKSQLEDSNVKFYLCKYRRAIFPRRAWSIFRIWKNAFFSFPVDTTPPRKILDKPNSTLFEVNAPGIVFLFHSLSVSKCSCSFHKTLNEWFKSQLSFYMPRAWKWSVEVWSNRSWRLKPPFGKSELFWRFSFRVSFCFLTGRDKTILFLLRVK